MPLNQVGRGGVKFEAAVACKNPAYEEIVPKLSGIGDEIERANLLYPPG